MEYFVFKADSVFILLQNPVNKKINNSNNERLQFKEIMKSIYGRVSTVNNITRH